MSRRILLYVALAVLVAGGLIVGVTVSRAQTGSKLPAITPAQLLANVATKAHNVSAIHGDFAWTNNLLPGADLASLAGRNSTPTTIASLLTGGKGRLWMQGREVRLEAQGQSGDLTVVAGRNGMWTYTSANNTATQYTLPAGAGAAKPSTAAPEPRVSAADPLTAITNGLERLAPTATTTVSGQETVAGRAAYILTLKPVSSITTFASADVAIDGKTFVPLRVRVFAAGDAKPVLSAGFSSVSYNSIAAKVFAFSAPKGTTVKHQAIKAPQGIGGAAGPGGTAGPAASPAGKTHARGLLGHGLKPLTLSQARTQATQAGLTLGVPTSVPASLPFEGAAVLPAHKGSGATAVLHYGKGFSSVVIVEHKGTGSAAQQSSDLQKQLGRLPGGLVNPMSVAGAPGHVLSTSLFSVIEWQRSGVTYAIAGMIPRTALTQLAASVH